MFLNRYNPLNGDLVSILREDGTCEETLRPQLTKEELRELYKQMTFLRLLDHKSVALQRQGRIGTYAQLEGQEAAQVGSVFDLRPDDWVVPSYRESGAMLIHGVPLDLMFLYWRGDERGSCFPEGVHVLPISIPVGSHALHAVGLALAAKFKKEQRVAVAYFGDGATSEGDVHEAWNFAGVFRTPTIFFCQNNQYAISVPRSKQTASKTIAQKAIAYGFPGIQVDGNDLFAVIAVMREALAYARSGQGPVLIEAVTFRMGAHTTADDPSRYRPEQELAEWAKRDPITRYRLYLQHQNLWSAEWEEELAAEATQTIEAAVEAMEKSTPPPPEDIFRYTFFQPTPLLLEQQQDLLAALREREG